MYTLLGTYVPKDDPQLAAIVKSVIARKSEHLKFAAMRTVRMHCRVGK